MKKLGFLAVFFGLSLMTVGCEPPKKEPATPAAPTGQPDAITEPAPSEPAAGEAPSEPAATTPTDDAAPDAAKPTEEATPDAASPEDSAASPEDSK